MQQHRDYDSCVLWTWNEPMADLASPSDQSLLKALWVLRLALCKVLVTLVTAPATSSAHIESLMAWNSFMFMRCCSSVICSVLRRLGPPYARTAPVRAHVERWTGTLYYVLDKTPAPTHSVLLFHTALSLRRHQRIGAVCQALKRCAPAAKTGCAVNHPVPPWAETSVSHSLGSGKPRSGVQKFAHWRDV